MSEKTSAKPSRPAVKVILQKKIKTQQAAPLKPRKAEAEEPPRTRRIDPVAITPAPQAMPLVEKKDLRLAHSLKETLAQQQELLDKYLDQIEEVENFGKEELRKQNQQLEAELIKLHDVIEKRDVEIEELYQQASSANKMASRIEDAYREFDQLQSKMQQLEKQAARANNLAIELEDTKNAYEALHNELKRKQDKLEDVMLENGNMRESLNEIEDKLSEANLQRQQLQKKVLFLTDLNNDMQSLSETNKKMQTELRRIGELESMLHMMEEERDFLLRRRSEK